VIIELQPSQQAVDEARDENYSNPDLLAIDRQHTQQIILIDRESKQSRKQIEFSDLHANKKLNNHELH